MSVHFTKGQYRNTQVKVNGRVQLVTSKRAEEIAARQRAEKNAAVENEAVELRQAELDAVLKASCKVLGRMDIHWKTRTRVWQLAFRGGEEYREAVLLAKSMCLGSNDRAKALSALGLR